MAPHSESKVLTVEWGDGFNFPLLLKITLIKDYKIGDSNE
jgi:hypothetical protein